MAHYRAIIISDNGEDFDTIIEPYDGLDEKYFVRKDLHDIELRYSKFLEFNPNWIDTPMEKWAKAMDYQHDEQGWFRMYNPNILYDWYTPDGGDFMVCNYIIPDGWPETLKVEDIDWIKWKKEYGQDKSEGIPLVIICSDGKVIDHLDMCWDEYEEKFWNIPNEYKGRYVRFDDFHI